MLPLDILAENLQAMFEALGPRGSDPLVQGLGSMICGYLKFIKPAHALWKVHKEEASKSEAFNSALVECAESHGISVDANPLVIETSDALIEALGKAGVANAEEEVSQVINRAMAREQWPWLSKHLSDEVRDAQRQLHEYLRNNVALGYSYLHPIETELEIFPDPDQEPGRKPLHEPAFFRPTGPTAVDFDQGYVVQVDEVVGKALEALRDERRGRYLLHGIAATGKSVIARDIAYRLHREGWQVRFLLGKRGFHDNQPRIMDEIRRFGKNGGKTLVVFEDAHIHPGDSNRFLQVFNEQQAPRLLVTSRHEKLREHIQTADKDNLAALFPGDETRYDLEPFASASRIIELFCNLSNIPYSEDLDRKIKEETKESLWVLAFALEALGESGGRKFTPDQIVNRVEKALDDIALLGGEGKPDKLYPWLLITISILYRKEVPTDTSYLKEKVFSNVSSVAVSNALDALSRMGEVVPIEEGAYYGLPHSSLADLYFLAGQRPKHKCRSCDGNASRYIAEYVHFGAGNWLGTSAFLDNDVITKLDVQKVARRLQECADGWGVGGFLYSLRAVNKDAAREIVGEMNPVENERLLLVCGCMEAGILLGSLCTANEEVARKIVSEMNPAEVARRLLERVDGEAGNFLYHLWRANKEATLEIIAAMGPAEVVQRADGGTALFLQAVEKVNVEAARKIIAELEPKKVAHFLEQIETGAGFFLTLVNNNMHDGAARKIVAEMAPAEVARRLLERADVEAGFLLRSVAEIHCEAALKIVAEMAPAEVARRLQERADKEAGSFLDFLRLADKEAAWKVVGEMDQAEVARRLLERLDFEAINFLRFLRKANEEVAGNIVAEMNPAEVAGRLQERADRTAGQFLNSLWETNEEAAREIVSAMTLTEVARRLQERSDSAAGRFLYFLRIANKVVARKIVAEMDHEEIALRLQKRTDTEARGFLYHLREANEEVARKIVEEMDPETRRGFLFLFR